METILVTGGAGFIGSHLCELLLSQGHTVICVDNFNRYYDPEKKKKNISLCLKNNNFYLYNLDITKLSDLMKIREKHTIHKICHLAARAGIRKSFEEPALYEEVNCKGTINVLELAKESNVKNMVFCSSSSVYGLTKQIPFEEDAFLNPCSVYGATKVAGEKFCFVYSNAFGIPIISLRFFTVYGPRGRPDMAAYKFTKSIINEEDIVLYGNGMKRDFTNVNDIVVGIKSALEKHTNGYDVVNLGSSNPISVETFIETIGAIVGKKPRVRVGQHQKGDILVTFANITKAKMLLGYEPKVDIVVGLKEFVDWFIREQAGSDEC